MLGDPRTVRVTGDGKAAVFRRTDDADAEDRPERYADRPIPEAYCWSNLTSGNGARAVWLLLLPFMVANLAHWMRPRARGSRRTTRLYGALVRLIALSLTVLLTAAACEVALDLLAWQCAGSAACGGERAWLGFVSPERGGWWSQPGRRLALAALVPAALVGLLWYLSNRTWSAYESQRPPSTGTGAPCCEPPGARPAAPAGPGTGRAGRADAPAGRAGRRPDGRAGDADDLEGRADLAAGHAADPAGHAADPAGHAADPAGHADLPAGRVGDGTGRAGAPIGPAPRRTGHVDLPGGPVGDTAGRAEGAPGPTGGPAGRTAGAAGRAEDAAPGAEPAAGAVGDAAGRADAGAGSVDLPAGHEAGSAADWAGCTGQPAGSAADRAGRVRLPGDPIRDTAPRAEGPAGSAATPAGPAAFAVGHPEGPAGRTAGAAGRAEDAPGPIATPAEQAEATAPGGDGAPCPVCGRTGTVPVPVRGTGPGPDRPPGGRHALGRPGFWYGRRHVARLRAAHTAAGFLTVAAAVTGAAARYDRSADGTALAVVGALIGVAIVVAGCAVLRVVLRRGRSERRIDARLDRAAVRQLPGAALVLLALALVHAAWSRPGWESAGTLPGDAVFRVIVLVQGALVVALAAAALRLHRRARHPRAVLNGLGGPAVAMLACALGGVMTGGVAQRVADWLDGPGTPGMGEGGTIPGPPVLLSWQASVIPVLLVVLLVPALCLAMRTWRTGRRLEAVVEREYGAVRPDGTRTRRIAHTRARARLTDLAPPVVGVVSAATLLLGVGAVAGAWLTGEVPGRAFAGSGPLPESAADTAQALGSWMVGFGFILFVALGRRAYRDASARRTIGILWDVGTFWPRAAHPFAPPCYAERAVPDLTWRMCTWTARTGGRLVISGHSQGSVLAAAAVWQLPAATRRRVALLTYGSPLERLYGRWFPAYFGPAALHGLRDDIDCWRNLWRPTDPIGGPVLPGTAEHGSDGPEVDREALRDPLVYGRDARHPLPEPILGHSDYQADPAFAEERAHLLARLAPAVPRQAGAPAEAPPTQAPPVKAPPAKPSPADAPPGAADGPRGQGSSGRSSV
ncbi:hypothetical protein [Streptomyces sp. NPDC005805]|uniref:hypothetical protein n=1 Tax=Streptomyces sp. NPDC005805 TaxID=3157068 RepID=UPI0033F019A9